MFMRKIILALCIACVAGHASGQANDGTERGPQYRPLHRKAISSPLYIAVSSGINNNVGIVGVAVDVPVSKHLCIDAGIGLSTWGYKFYGGGKYFLRPHQVGWAFGAGVTFNTGINTFNDNLETVYGTTEPVTLQLNPQVNLVVAAYRYWLLGRGSNRFYLELGYSIPLTGGDRFTQTAGDEIDNNSVTTVNLLSPGGLIAAVGFSFGIK
jgi:hypothetical protein